MENRKIGIIGTGAVGMTFAFAAEMSGLCRNMILVDVNRERLEGEVMDLNHGLPFVPRMSIASGEIADLTDADVVLLAAGAKQASGESRLDLVKRNARIVKNILKELRQSGFGGVLLVVANPVDILTRLCVEHSGLPRGHVLGSGTVLDTARFRYFLSDLINIDPHNIHAYIIGEHGDSEVALWSSASVSGIDVEAYCRLQGILFDASVKQSITDRVRDSAYHIIESKGVTNYAISLAILRIVKAIFGDERRILSVSSYVDGLYGLEDVCIGIPTIVGAHGTQEIIELPISEEELGKLRESSNKLKAVYEDVSANLL